MIKLSLKYRPERLEELVGQDWAKTLLAPLFRSGKEKKDYQTMLFYGQSGVGKTTMARIVANRLNAEVYELDASTHNGVEDIRKIQQTIKRKPIARDNIVIILDECHMLSKSAFNALLKTLEEPPEYVYFILCTTEVDKVPITVVHRCLEVRLMSLSVDEVVSLLYDVAQREKIKITDEEARRLAKNCEGSARNALNLLEEFALTGQITITEEEDVAQLILLYSGTAQGVEVRLMKHLNSMYRKGNTPINIMNKACNQVVTKIFEEDRTEYVPLLNQLLAIQMKLNNERYHLNDYLINLMVNDMLQRRQ